MPKLTEKAILAKQILLQIKYVKNEWKNTLERSSLIGLDFDAAESIAKTQRKIEVLNAIEEQLIALSQQSENSQLSN